MDLTLLLKAALMGLVEGLTEFLPVSSTGHLILAGALIGFTEGQWRSAKVFEIVIQTGAIGAVLMVYGARVRAAARGAWRGDLASRRLCLHVLIGFLPAMVLGATLSGVIKTYLFSAPWVAGSFVLGGLVILWAERRQVAAPRVESLDQLSRGDALKVGLAQCLALVPGTSRSGATIIGGMLLGLSRQAATDFSFFLAMPVLLGASAYSLWRERSVLSWADVPLLTLGTLVAFGVAWVVVRWLLRFVSTHSFVPFAWYRIGFGALVLLTWERGWVQWVE